MKIEDAKEGMNVYLLKDIYDGPDEYSPGGYLARHGDILIIKKLRPDYNCMSVHHPHVTNGSSFTVYPHEIVTETPLITILEQREYAKKYGKERGGLK